MGTPYNTVWTVKYYQERQGRLERSIAQLVCAYIFGAVFYQGAFGIQGASGKGAPPWYQPKFTYSLVRVLVLAPTYEQPGPTCQRKHYAAAG